MKGAGQEIVKFDMVARMRVVTGRARSVADEGKAEMHSDRLDLFVKADNAVELALRAGRVPREVCWNAAIAVDLFDFFLFVAMTSLERTSNEYCRTVIQSANFEGLT